MTADARIVIEVNGAEVAREIRQVKVSLEELKRKAAEADAAFGKMGGGNMSAAFKKTASDMLNAMREMDSGAKAIMRNMGSDLVAMAKSHGREMVSAARSTGRERIKAAQEELDAVKRATAAGHHEKLSAEAVMRRKGAADALAQARQTSERGIAQARSEASAIVSVTKRQVEELKHLHAKAAADARSVRGRGTQVGADAGFGMTASQIMKARGAVDGYVSSLNAATKPAAQMRDLSGQMAKAMLEEERAANKAAEARRKLAQTIVAEARASGNRAAHGPITSAGDARWMSVAELQRASKGVEQFAAAADHAAKKSRVTLDSLANLSIGTSSLGRLMANTSVVIQGFFAAFAIREIVHANMELERFTNTIKAVSATPQEAAASLEYLRATADRVGTSLTEIGTPFARFTLAGKNAGFTTKELQQAFFELTAASRNFGLSGADTAGVIRALEQSLSKGKFMAEEVRLQLGDRLPVAMQAMAKATGKTSAELNKMFEDGQLMTDQYFIPFVRAIFDMSGGMAALQRSSQSMTAELNRLQTAFLDAAGVIGENGFNQAISESARALNEFMKSEDGVAMLKSIGVAASAVGTAFKTLVPFIDEMALAFMALATGALAQTAIKVAAIVAGMNPWVRGIMLAVGALGFIIDATEEWNKGNDAARKGMELLNTSVGAAQTVAGQASTQYGVLTGKAWEMADATLSAAIAQKQLNLELANSRIDEVRGRLPPDDSIGRGSKRDKELREQLALMEAQRQKISDEIRDLETRRDGLSAQRIMTQVGDGAVEAVKTEQQRNAALAEGVALREKMLPLVKAEAERTQELQRITDVYAKGGLTLAQAIELTAQAHENYAKSVEKVTGAQKEQKRETREALAEFEKSGNALDTAMGRVEVQGVDSAAKNLLTLKDATAEYRQKAAELQAEIKKGGATEREAAEIREQLAAVSGKLAEADERLIHGREYLIKQWDDESKKLRERAEEIDANTRITLLEADGSEASRRAIFDLTKARELNIIAANEQREITQMTADAHYVEGIMAEESRAAIERKTAEYANLKRATSEALDAQEWKRYADDVRRVADDIARDWSETLFDSLILKDKEFDIIQSFKDLFRRIGIEALKAQIVLPITTAIVGSMPGLFGVNSPAGAANVAGSIAGAPGAGGGGMMSLLQTGMGIGNLGTSLAGGGLTSLGTSIATSGFGQAIGMSTVQPIMASGPAAAGFESMFGAASGGLEIGASAVPTAFGEAFAGGLGGAPWGILGSLGANLLGLGWDNPVAGMAAGAAGSIGGGMAGFAVGGPVGAAIGAILGAFGSTALGELFADVKIPYGSSTADYRNGQAAYRDTAVLDEFDIKPVTDALGQFGQAAASIAQVTGTRLQDFASRITVGRDYPSFSVGRAGTDWWDADETFYKAEELTPSGAIKALKALMRNGIFEGMNKDALKAANLYRGSDAEVFGKRVAYGQAFNSTVKRLTGNTDPTEGVRAQTKAWLDDVIGFRKMAAETFGKNSTRYNKAADAVRTALRVFAGLEEAKRPLSAVEMAVKSVRAKFAELAEVSRGLARRGLNRTLREMRNNYNEGIEDQILAIEDPQALALKHWREERKAALRDARAIGGDIEAVTRLYELRRLEIIEQFAEAGVSAMESALADGRRIYDQIGLGRQEFAEQIKRHFAGLTTVLPQVLEILSAASEPSAWRQYREAFAALETFFKAPDSGMTPERYLELQQIIADTYQQAVNGINETASAEAALAEQRQAQAADLKAWLDQQRFGANSSLSPTARLAEAQRQFNEQMSLARGGDPEAFGRVTSQADILLEAARAMYASTSQFASIESMVRSQIAGLGRSLGLPGFAEGGLITGGIPGMDSVPIMAMPGERVFSVQHSRIIENLAASNDNSEVVAALNRVEQKLGALVNVSVASGDDNSEGLGAIKEELVEIRSKARLAASR
jgi:tape measure domain-containing protein